MKKCNMFCCVATVLASIGAMNWGLVGAFDFNLVSWLVTTIGLPVIVQTIIYILVGIAGVFTIIGKIMKK